MTNEERALERARELDPTLKNLERNIGALQIRLARHESAIAEYRKALKIYQRIRQTARE